MTEVGPSRCDTPQSASTHPHQHIHIGILVLPNAPSVKNYYDTILDAENGASEFFTRTISINKTNSTEFHSKCQQNGDDFGNILNVSETSIRIVKENFATRAQLPLLPNLVRTRTSVDQVYQI